MHTVLTTCEYCGCGCNFYLGIEKGTINATYPSTVHPVSQGKLCIKGWQGHEFVQSQERLKSPLIKEGKTFREASWDEAYEVITNEFTQIKAQFGSDAISVLTSAKCTNEENFLLQKFTRAVIGTNNIDHCARL